MSAPELWSVEQALIYAAIAKQAASIKEDHRVDLNQVFRDGRVEHVRSPLGDRLGYVEKTDPDPTWTVDEPELLEHMRQFEGVIGTRQRILDEALAIKVLAVHAPELLVTEEYVLPEVRRAAVQQSEETGEPAAPGIRKVKPSGIVRVNPDKQAFQAVQRMVRAGLLDLGATPSLPAVDPAAVDEPPTFIDTARSA